MQRTFPIVLKINDLFTTKVINVTKENITKMDAELSLLNSKLIAADTAKKCGEEFAVLKTDSERFAYTLRLLHEYGIKPKYRCLEKNTKDSENQRKAANELFTLKETRQLLNNILETYTRSIAFAPPKSRELSFAYGNRSALLYKAKLYDHCMIDIERAVRLDCPDTVKIKLLIRRIRCLKAQCEIQSQHIEDSVEEIERLIEKMSIENPNRKKLENDLEDAKKSKIIPPQRKLFHENKYKPPTPNDNLEIPGVSSALKISYDENFGRHVISTRKISTGEVLCVQKGYATILAPEHFYTHCSNCLKQTWSSIPCDRCVRAVYCDENCRAEAWKNHHDIECGVIDALLDCEISLLGMMSLRLAIRAVREAGGFEELQNKLRSATWPNNRTKGFTGTPPRLNEHDYLSVYTLAKNTSKRSGPDLFGRSFNAVFIVYCVATITDFLGNKIERNLRAVQENPWSVFLGGLITRHQQIIPSNVHTVQEMIGIESRERGASIIPFLSLFNHSCDCMVTRIHYGTDVVVYANHTIEAGEQIYDNYGPHYAVADLCSRQQKLRRQFFFECKCRPCIENWPEFSNIPSWRKQKLDTNAVAQLQNVLKDFPLCVKLATDGQIEGKLHVIKDLENMIEMLFKFVKLPCQEVNEVVETLKRVYTLLGTRYQSLRSN